MAKDVYIRYRIPEKITVLIDTREQYPMLFPKTVRVAHPERPFLDLTIKVEIGKKKLDFGDYALEGYENVCTIERKASQLELFKNLSDPKDRGRQARSFRRLVQGCKFPYLLVECSPSQLLADNERIKQPEVVAHRLALTLAKYGLHALFIPWRSRSAEARRKMGTFLIHIMLGCILSETYDVPVNLLD